MLRITFFFSFFSVIQFFELGLLLFFRVPNAGAGTGRRHALKFPEDYVSVELIQCLWHEMTPFLLFGAVVPDLFFN